MPVRLTRAHQKPADLLLWQIHAADLPAPVPEFRATPPRKFAWDLAWPVQRVLVDVNGQTWHKGGHSSGTGIERDYEKLALATLAGFRCFYVTTTQVERGEALGWIEQALVRLIGKTSDPSVRHS